MTHAYIIILSNDYILHIDKFIRLLNRLLLSFTFQAKMYQFFSSLYQ